MRWVSAALWSSEHRKPGSLLSDTLSWGPGDSWLRPRCLCEHLSLLRPHSPHGVPQDRLLGNKKACSVASQSIWVWQIALARTVSWLFAVLGNLPPPPPPPAPEQPPGAKGSIHPATVPCSKAVAAIRWTCPDSSSEGERTDVCVAILLESLKPSVRRWGTQDMFIEYRG